MLLSIPYRVIPESGNPIHGKPVNCRYIIHEPLRCSPISLAQSLTLCAYASNFDEGTDCIRRDNNNINKKQEQEEGTTNSYQPEQ